MASNIKNISVKQKIIIAATYLVCWIFWLIFVYACITFLQLDRNPVNWNWDSRYYMITCGVIFHVGILIFIGVLNLMGYFD